MSVFQNFIISKLLQEKIIGIEEVEVYQFGIECFVLKMVNCVTCALIAVAIGTPVQLVGIGIGIAMLRKNTGGYHAKTKFGCYLFSCTTITIGMIICKYCDYSRVWEFLWAASNIVIFKFAPLGTQNNPLSEVEIRSFRRNSIYILMILDGFYLLTYFFDFLCIHKMLDMSIIITALLLLIGKIS